MRRPIKSCNNTIFVSVLTAGYIALFVLFIWLRQWQLAGNERLIFLPHLLLNIGFATVQIFCFFFALTLHRYLLAALLPIIFVTSTLHLYMVKTYESRINDQIIAAVIEATPKEVVQFGNAPLLCMTLGAFVLSLLIAIYFWRCVTLRPQEQKAARMCLFMSLFLIFANGGSMSVDYPPYNILTASVQYTWKSVINRQSIKPPQGFTYAEKDSHPLKIVLIIGESARADHLALYGYNRPTTPYTSKLKNILVFKDVTSCGVLTRVAVPCIMTRSLENNDDVISLFGVFNALGFHTAWLGAQGSDSATDLISRIIREAQSSAMLEKGKLLENSVLDEELLPLLDKESKNNASAPLFAVLHLYGSHWQYQARYPQAFEYFAPVCNKTYAREFNISAQMQEIRSCAADLPLMVNAYDNTIRYTDYIVSEVINRFAQDNAVVVYLSDHAESLGEQGRYLHGDPDAPEQRHIPMLWWASDAFIAAHAGEWQSLAQKTTTPLQQSVLFPSLLNCIRVQTETLDPSESLCGTTSSGKPTLTHAKKE
jgi:glucan phosphoethanolaminetransferase (alkaline phosphatase superfamily)